ncbi:chemotaxis protein CheA [Thiomicrospira sp. ALE5]|uniref:chemotaxis protein CheA n=1 Tax=Thiomicrospira sp. ALE5 TaxID=748650 RepID=UPI0008E26C9F|nr:chemotaxis protein CheA [Thiomicrospira sp. ALE5]SFR59109.1 two-component system, chemotaxis family, sensor kinase CheA [Thiomicrospira sp. ALE5]
MDEEILQDFLVEADELLVQLDEQLISLEAAPQDTDLLNAIFRGFHTIKGGAGFLGVTPLVSVCHLAENVFDRIRNQQIDYDPSVADAILNAFDVVRDMISALQQGERELEEPPASLLTSLEAIYRGDVSESADDSTGSEPSSTESEASDADLTTLALPDDLDPDGDITDDEFEALLAQRDNLGSATKSNEPASSVSLALPEGVDPDGEITDDEFEALLAQRDSLDSATKSNESASAVNLALPEGVDPDGEITDEEFEALLAQRDQTVLAADNSMPTTSVKPKVDQTEPPNSVSKPVSKTAPTVSKSVAKADTAPKHKLAPTAAAPESTVRVDTRRLDEIMNLVGELVLVRNRLLTIRSQDAETEALANAVSNLDHVTTDLQAAVMKTRMQPVKKVFGRFPRVVRDLSRKLGKQIDLELRGEDTDLDKNLVEALSDPLVHLVRNSVDHGIEMPEDRANQGKDKTGKIILAAEQEGDHILLSILDDGKGMDPDLLRRKAVEKGLMDELAAQQLEDSKAFMLIMAAGFSTAEQVSDISGRGVGMDVVKNMITKLNGSIEIDSRLGEGTRILIRVPLTLAILPTLMVSFDGDSYAIPLTSVQEIFDYNADNVNFIDNRKMVRLRDKSVPLLFLSNWLKPDAMVDDFTGYKVVMVSFGNQRVGFVVEQVNGQEEVVIKPLGVKLSNLQGYAGATITGNGSIALILDVPGVVERFE